MWWSSSSNGTAHQGRGWGTRRTLHKQLVCTCAVQDFGDIATLQARTCWDGCINVAAAVERVKHDCVAAAAAAAARNCRVIFLARQHCDARVGRERSLHDVVLHMPGSQAGAQAVQNS